MAVLLPLWQRLLITVAAMLAVSFVVSLLWSSLLGWTIPGYVSGVVGGVTALPVWEFLKRIRPGH
ncbi:hypothetical protein [Roseibium sp.]|uniref:hypothetical protein n=1 Tax=Roseibium sp. TaxID=1936156 RepID=UPI003D0F8FD0